jgi:hypothetical protein
MSWRGRFEASAQLVRLRFLASECWTVTIVSVMTGQGRCDVVQRLEGPGFGLGGAGALSSKFAIAYKNSNILDSAPSRRRNQIIYA